MKSPELPDFDRAFEYENAFYLSCDSSRMSKALAHYELFKMTVDLPGAIVECGVFKGASFARFAMFRDLFSHAHSKRLVGFDTFGDFPETAFEADKVRRESFVQAAGGRSLSTDQLRAMLRHKGCDRNVDLVAGDVRETIPAYLAAHRELKISLLNLDTDVYEPAVVILEHLYPRLVPGGVLLLDDYGVFPGETRAVDDYFQGKASIRKFPWAQSPCYLIK